MTDGAIVTAYQGIPLATVQTLDPIYVDVPQSTSEWQHLRCRMADGRLNPDGPDQNKVKLIFEDGTVYPSEGVLQFREVTVDPMTGSFILRIVFPNPEGVLLPGMFVRVEVKEGVNRQAILIPQQGVSRNSKGDPLALIVDDDQNVQQRTLTLDRALGDKWLVSAGLMPGDQVIVGGAQRVRPGMRVKGTAAVVGNNANASTGNTPPPAPESN